MKIARMLLCKNTKEENGRLTVKFNTKSNNTDEKQKKLKQIVFVFTKNVIKKYSNARLKKHL